MSAGDAVSTAVTATQSSTSSAPSSARSAALQRSSKLAESSERTIASSAWRRQVLCDPSTDNLSRSASHCESSSVNSSAKRPANSTPRAIFAEAGTRSEEHTSELQSLMRISYAVFCLTKKTTKQKKYI